MHRYFYLLFAVFFLIQCGSDNAPTEMIDFADFQEPAHHLNTVMQFTEDEDFFLGRVHSVAADSKGRIYAADGSAKSIFVFNEEGRRLASIGREGQGPGEFSNIGVVHIGEGDTLYTYDWSNRRVSVFAETGTHSWEYMYGITLQQHPDQGYPSGGFRVTGMGYVVNFSLPFMPQSMGGRAEGNPFYSVISRDGTIERDKMIDFKQPEMVVQATANMVRAYGLPFARRGIVKFNNDGYFHRAYWTDSLAITTFNLDGDSLWTVSVPVKEREITEDQIVRATNGRDTEYYKETVNRIAKTHPAMTDFFVDDDGLYWVNMGEISEDVNLWVVLTKQSQTAGSFHIPKTTRIDQIQNNKVYASVTDEFGAPGIAIFSYEPFAERYLELAVR